MKSCQLMTVNNSITINRFCFTRCFLYQSSGNQVTVFRDQRLTEYNLKFHLCWYFCSDLMSAHHQEMNGSPGAGYLEVAVMHHAKASGGSVVNQICSQTVKNSTDKSKQSPRCRCTCSGEEQLNLCSFFIPSDELEVNFLQIQICQSPSSDDDIC